MDPGEDRRQRVAFTAALSSLRAMNRVRRVSGCKRDRQWKRFRCRIWPSDVSTPRPFRFRSPRASLLEFERGSAILRRRVRQSASRPRQGNNAHLSGFVFLRNLFSARHKRTTGDIRKEVPRDPV